VAARVRQEFLRYTAVSAVAWLVDVCVLYLAALQLGLPEYLSAAIGYSVGLVVHYLLSVRYVFNYRRMAGRAPVELAMYALAGLVGMVLSAGIVHIGTLLHMPLIVSKLVATAAAFVAVFGLRKVALFSSTGPDREHLP